MITGGHWRTSGGQESSRSSKDLNKHEIGGGYQLSPSWLENHE